MKYKNISIYISVIILIIGIIFAFKNEYSVNTKFQKLYNELDNEIDNIFSIEIESNSDTFSLIKKEGKWVLPNYQEYPADETKILDFLLKVSQLRTVDKKTQNPELFNKLGLSFPIIDDAKRIRLLSKNRNLIADFIIGKNFVLNNELSYVRKFDEDQSWLFKNEFNIYDNEINWTRNSLLRIARWRIKSINIKDNDNKSKNIFFFKDKYSDQSFKLKDIPKGASLRSNVDANNLSSILESVKIANIKKKSNEKKYRYKKDITFTSFDGLVVNIKTFELDKQMYFDFDIVSDFSVREELPDDSPTIVGLPNMLSIDQVESEVKKYIYLKDWHFILYNDFIKNFNVTFSDLIEEK